MHNSTWYLIGIFVGFALGYQVAQLYTINPDAINLTQFFQPKSSDVV